MQRNLFNFFFAKILKPMSQMKKVATKQVISKQQLHVLHVFKSAMNTHFSFLLAYRKRGKRENITREIAHFFCFCPGFNTQLHHSCYFSFTKRAHRSEKEFFLIICVEECFVWMHGRCVGKAENCSIHFMFNFRSVKNGLLLPSLISPLCDSMLSVWTL